LPALFSLPASAQQETIVLKMMNAGILALVICATVAPSAQAQMQWTDRGFLNVNGGAQTGSHSLGTDATFELYKENARLTSTQSVKGGGFFDITAGYKVWRNLALGVGYTHTGSDTDVAIAASVPDPLFYDAPRAVTLSASGAKHSENAVNISGTWMVPVTDKIDVDVAFGPTIFAVKQDVPTAISVTEPGPSVNSTTMNSESKSTVGIHFGFDVNYLFTKRIGAGLVARYSWGSVDLPGATDKLTVGGFQIGAGVRVRF
jgi:hypothetical protein